MLKIRKLISIARINNMKKKIMSMLACVLGVICLSFAFSFTGCAQNYEKLVVPTESRQDEQKIRPNLQEIQDMVRDLANQYTGLTPYKLSNEEFLKRVQEQTVEYAQPGYFDRASAYRDVINVAYVREQNLPSSLGYILAMSRSKFTNQKNGNDEGLWQMSNDFIASNGHYLSCETDTVSDPSQRCAAKASSSYMKALAIGVFEGDIFYGIAAFGKTAKEAAIWKETLSADRSDVWNSVKTLQERDQITRFFAAGIVAENPQKFGLSDKPLFDLYRLTKGSVSVTTGSGPTGLVAVEEYGSIFLRQIAQNDSSAFLTTEQAQRVQAKIKDLSASAALAVNLSSAVRNSDRISSLSKTHDQNPNFLAVATITKLGTNSGDVVQTAKSMLDTLEMLNRNLGTEFADDALLVMAAYGQGERGEFMKMRNLLQELANESPASVREIRTIWFLERNRKISAADFDMVLTFLAIGTISQNPKAFGVNAEALSSGR